MKRLLIITVVFLLVFSSCTKNKSSVAVDIKAERAKIEAVLEQYVVANEGQDLGLIHKIWAGKESIVMIGTDSDERLVGWNMIMSATENQFKEFEETYIAVSDQKIFVNETGNTAWFNELMNYNFVYQGEAKSFSGMRFTGVLEKLNGEWCLVQGHLSIPAEVEMNEVY